jgi:diguanylate cyclase (GGDEF)-like protein/putative nucleotidyltransferase with HDIG domain/PAS domain S-box-containing protein
LGLLPDTTAAEMKSRRRLSESIAINAAAHVRKNQWLDLEVALETLVDRDAQLLSVGIRSNLGTLRVDSGHHSEIWEKSQDSKNGVDAISVPITLNRREWGQVELCFDAPVLSTYGAILEHPLMRLLAFFCIVGTIGYTLFVANLMKVFSTTQVVPERVRQALDTLAEGLLVLDEHARIVLANDAFSQTVDVDLDGLVDTSANDLPWELDPQHPAEDYPWMMAINDSTMVTEQMLHLNVGDGRRRIFSVNATPIGGNGARRGALTTFRDVTHIEEHRAELETMLSMLRSSRDEIEKKNRELEILATQDALTGCLNRRAFFERFGRLWTLAKREGKPLACIMIDNDHFKRVNDTYGHAVGDEVLRRVSAVLREQHGSHGLVCRYGGEEFCVLLPAFSFEQAIELGEETRKAIEAIVFEDPSELRLTASIGVSETRFEAADPQELINQADVCLYAAKRGGRNCVVPFHRDLESLEEAAEDHEDRGDHDSRTDLSFQAVTALLSSLSYRDPQTAEHCRRVADLCSTVAAELLGTEDVYMLEVAALLHDIGKVAVPDEVLFKPDSVTRRGREIIGRHERIGVEIIRSAFDCEELTNIVQTKHAHYGGTRLYQNLPAGEDIPIAARILAICDCYDAMTFDRLDRKGCSHLEAVQELQRCAGKQFDPKLVEHFVGVIKEIPSHAGKTDRNETLLQISFLVEQLANATDEQDCGGIRTLAGRLSEYARRCEIASIADVAATIGAQTEADEVSWLDVVRTTNELLEICRDNQSDLLCLPEEAPRFFQPLEH